MNFMKFVCSVILISSTFYPNSVEGFNILHFALELVSDLLHLNPEKAVEYYTENTTLSKYDNCSRTCVSGESRVCYYEFILELYATLSPVCGNCSSGVLEDCFAEECVPADGVERGFMSINRKLPGPVIEVCKNDFLVVKMKNSMTGMASTIHWHGILQTGTPYMDGVPYFTQCPITDGDSFLYSFWTNQSGTYFYHSHSGDQLTNGIVSSLIVRDVPDEDPHYDLYDVDNHTLFIYDWTHEYSEMFNPGLVSAAPGIATPVSFLINGHGVTTDDDTNITTTTPYATFYVDSGLRYRFRTVGGVGLICPVRIQIENHTMSMISADGTDVEPVTVNSFIIYPGEKYDFILNANQTSGNYWIHAKGVGACATQSLYQTAVLAYDQNTTTYGLVPTTEKPTSDGYDVGIILNDQTSYCNDSSSLCPSQLQSMSNNATDLTNEPDYIFPLNFARVNVDADVAFDTNSSNWISYEVNPGGRLTTHVINGIQSYFQASPFLSQRSDIDQSLICNIDNLPARCNGTDVCRCNHILAVELNSAVHVVLMDTTAAAGPVSHPAHMHGHEFYVLKSGHFDNTTTIESVQNMTLAELLADNPSPVRKDTIPIPSSGYAIIRFIANNPGFWLMHCHIEPHLSSGMMLGWQVGEYDDFPAVPDNFPTCGNFAR